jgi:hypothetical protein
MLKGREWLAKPKVIERVHVEQPVATETKKAA